MKSIQIGAFDAKTHFSELLQGVIKGKTFEILRRGKPVAQLTSIRAADNSRVAHNAEWAPPSWYGALAAYARRNRVGSDMKTIRTSIARGIVAERHLL